ncbi:hypothetical protein [Stenotrophomonas bentonitica]|uniref:hypothetical protein n=1 Tax=Stenotrophomonas bentonitica TaxID=1450134 RepID=UPI0031B9FE12
MTNATPFFPLSTEQQHHAIVGLACHGTPAPAIAAAVEVELLTVCEVLNRANIQPILLPRTFRIENIEWDTDGEVIERLPSEGTITVKDWEHWEFSDPEGAEYRALSEFSDLHGYCMIGSKVTEVTGAAWPTTPQEAAGLVESANRMGELRMGDGRYALVTHETLAHCYPEHLANHKRVLGNDFHEDWGNWKFMVIDTQDAAGLRVMTSDIVDLIPLLLKLHKDRGHKGFMVFVAMLIAMGLKRPQAMEHRNEVFHV